MGAFEYSINKAPTIDSGPSANPTTANVGTTVAFSVSASDPNGDTLNYSWAFGDGSTGTGNSPSHAYQMAGSFIATVTVSDGNGGSANASTTVTVNDSSGGGGGGGGGTGGGDGTPTPSGTLPAADQPLTVTKALIKVSFKRTDIDAIKVMGTLPVTEGFNPEGQQVDFYAHGSVYSFTLDAKGRSPKSTNRFMLKAKRKKKVIQAGDAKFKIFIKKGSFASNMVTEGMTDETVKDKTIDWIVRLNFNGVMYGTGDTTAGANPLALNYKGKEGKGGKAKGP